MRTKALGVAALALCLVSLLSAPALPSGSGPRAHGIIDRQEPCYSTDTLLPEHHELPVVGDWTTEVVLDVHVLVVEFDPEKAAEVMDIVADLYSELGIKVKTIIEEVALEVDVPPDTSPGGVLPNSAHSGAYIQASKDYFGGERPWWADVVYTMLGGELASTVAGQADCVGGIAYPHEAFAVGEATAESDYEIRRTAKIAAHEIAHLLAAHHHFANCAEGNKEDEADRFYPCTLMFNDVGLISIAFSTLEGAVVRRWALDYANDTPTSEPAPPPTAEPIVRTVTIKRAEGSVVTGLIGDQGAEGDGCTAKASVIFQRKSKKGWKHSSFAVSDEASRFSFETEAPGVYRALAPHSESRAGVACPRAVSNKLSVE